MDETKKKILTKLDELMAEAMSLKSDIKDHEDLRVRTWKIATEKLLERIGGEKLIRDFRSSTSFSFNVMDGDDERLEYKKKVLEGGKNFLKITKDDLELFEDSDEKELKKIKHKFEAGIDIGIVKGKYTHESEKDPH